MTDDEKEKAMKEVENLKKLRNLTQHIVELVSWELKTSPKSRLTENLGITSRGVQPINSTFKWVTVKVAL